MAQYQHLPIYKATYDLLVKITHATSNFPKAYKYSLGDKNFTDQATGWRFRKNLTTGGSRNEIPEIHLR